jgi:predicted Zn-ribbon and HTH transcriptional regulator
MGPTKTIVKDGALYDAKTGKLLKAGFLTHAEMEGYATRHYMVLPETDKKGTPWNLDGKPVYCLHGTRYETLDDQHLHLARCPDCGGMGIRADEFTVESDCIRCIKCGHEFDARLEMMES